MGALSSALSQLLSAGEGYANKAVSELAEYFAHVSSEAFCAVKSTSCPFLTPVSKV